MDAKTMKGIDTELTELWPSSNTVAEVNLAKIAKFDHSQEAPLKLDKELMLMNDFRLVQSSIKWLNYIL